MPIGLEMAIMAQEIANDIEILGKSFDQQAYDRYHLITLNFG